MGCNWGGNQTAFLKIGALRMDPFQMTMKSDTEPDIPPHERENADSTKQRPLTEAARRALAEAEERRRARNAASAKAAREIGGRDGPDPVRYGDWEKDGIASDF